MPSPLSTRCAAVGIAVLLFSSPLSAQGTVRVSKNGDGGGIVQSVPPNAIDCGSKCASTYAFQGAMTLVANPNPNSMFTGWSGDCSGMTCALWVNGNKNVTANFSVMPTLTTIVSGPGAVGSLPPGIACTSGRCSAQFNPGSSVALGAIAAPGAVWLGYSGGGCGSAPNCTVTLSSSTTVTARFATPTLKIALNGDGDVFVTSNPSGISCSRGSTSGCAFTFPPGSTVALSAEPLHSAFTGWGQACGGTGLTCTVTMDNQKTVSVNASKGPLTVIVKERAPIANSQVDINKDILCGATCAVRMFGDAPVRLQALVNDPRAVFQGWAVSGVSPNPCAGSSPICSFMFPTDVSPVTVTAVFGQPVLSLSKTGSGDGTLTFTASTPATSLTCAAGCRSPNNSSRAYSAGTQVLLTIVPNAGSVLRSVAPAAVCGGSGCGFALNANTTVLADFGRLFGVSITPSLGGSISGLVGTSACSTSSPAGCNAMVTDSPTPITLTATPGPGFHLGMWGGACASSGTSPTCQLYVTNQNLTVTYTFSNQ